MLDDFMWRAALAGVGLACVAGPLGCFVVWRRMAYFGDATAHAAILGVALSLAFSVSIFLGVLVMALAMASVTSMLSGRLYAMDTLLGVAAHAALAFGLVAVSFLSGVRVDLMAYLVGDILAVGFGDLAMIWIGAAAALVLLCWRWRSLLTVTLNADLAAARRDVGSAVGERPSTEYVRENYGRVRQEAVREFLRGQESSHIFCRAAQIRGQACDGRPHGRLVPGLGVVAAGRP